MTDDEALAAIQTELGSERSLSTLPPDIREHVARFVTRGICTAAQAAEALATAMALADAREEGRICDREGLDVMARLGARHRDGGEEPA